MLFFIAFFVVLEMNAWVETIFNWSNWVTLTRVWRVLLLLGQCKMSVVASERVRVGVWRNEWRREAQALWLKFEKWGGSHSQDLCRGINLLRCINEPTDKIAPEIRIYIAASITPIVTEENIIESILLKCSLVIDPAR